MNYGQALFDFVPRTKLTLAAVEQRIRKFRIIEPCPSRPTLIAMCLDGTFESVGKDGGGFPAPTRFGWLIYEESFLNWARQLDGLAPVDLRKAA